MNREAAQKVGVFMLGILEADPDCHVELSSRRHGALVVTARHYTDAKKYMQVREFSELELSACRFDLARLGFETGQRLRLSAVETGSGITGVSGT